jgi:ubiquinol-cytochrome c reductase cytochrome c subunit
MMRIRGNVAAAIAAVWFGSVGVCAAQAPAAQTAQTAAAPAAKGNVEAGKAAYDKYLCWTCHNPAAHGGAGPRLGPGPMALPAFIRYVRKPTGVMPPFTEKVMTDQELGDIHAFLASLPRPQDSKTIPLLQDPEK